MAENTNSKWEGINTAELKGVTADQVWPLLADFCNINKWFYGLDKCYRVEGEEGKAGVVRYCAAASQTFFDTNDCEQTTFTWAKEKLLTIDPKEMCLSYEIAENNMGITSYVATFKVLPDGEDGCRLEWTYAVDPIQGMTLENYKSFRTTYLENSVKNIQTLLSAFG